MTVKLKDEPYMMLPYGNLAIPLSMATEVLKHSMFVDRSYNSEISDYVFKVYHPGGRTTMDTTVIDADVIKAAIVASKLENA